MGLGWVLWDHHGNFLSAVSQPWNGSYYPEEAESLAIREALSWSKSQSLEHLHAETDLLMGSSFDQKATVSSRGHALIKRLRFSSRGRLRFQHHQRKQDDKYEEYQQAKRNDERSHPNGSGIKGLPASTHRK
nr:uncharacterized protein LOC109149045 [Ipomoea batatas]